MSLLNTYNNENIISRAVIAGLLGVLNNDIKYEQAWANDDIEEVQIPWFYNQSGDERFMQDFYTHYADCNFPRPVDGNFDVIPRGVITYTGSSIDSNRITNRFVRARYLKLVDGKLESFVSFMYSIPLTIKFDCELWVDTHVAALKIEQSIREAFYKTVTFYMYYKGMRLGATAGFSEDYTVTKNIQYSFEQDNRIKLTFNIEVESYQPVFDQSTEMKANNRIKGFAYNIYEYDEKSYGNIFITNPSDNITVPKGYPLWIEWKSNKEGAIINKINASWSPVDSSALTLIEGSVLNNEYYIWNIPSNFTNYKMPTIIYEEDAIIGVHKNPLVSIVPDFSTNMISTSSFSIIDPGQFIAPSRDCSIGVMLEMKKDNGKISYSPDNYIYANIVNYKLDSFWMQGDLLFPGSVNYKSIDLHISNTTHPSTESIIRNIKIV
jgi:hypothetical protein